MLQNGSKFGAIVRKLSPMASALALSYPAFAQDAASPAPVQESGKETPETEAIIVTATRRSESVRDVPFNVQAISSSTLGNMGATDIVDFARTVPGLSISDGGARTGVTLVLRGLRTGNETGLAPTTTVYVDEVPMDLPYRGAPLDLKLIDIERVEVLRGPQGTLFGGGAIGGTLRYISKKPGFNNAEGRTGVELSTTRLGGINYNATAMVNLPIADWAALRVNVAHFNNDGFVDNVRLGLKNVNDDKTTSARIALRLQPSADLSVDISYYRQNARYGEASQLFESQPSNTLAFAFDGNAQFKAQLANITLGYDFGWADLTASSSYVDERMTSYTDSTYAIRDVIFGSFLDAADLPEFLVVTDRVAKSYNFTQEVRLVSSSDGPFDWIIGAYYKKGRVREDQQELVPIPFPGQAAFEQNIIGAELNDNKEYTYQQIDKTRQIAAFGELNYQITDAWRASVGGRVFNIRGNGNFYAIDQWLGQNARDSNGMARTVPLPSELATGRYRAKGSVWRFNTSYKFDDSLIYLTIAQGFRPGGFNSATPNTGIPPEGRQFESDDLISYELGTKLSLANDRVYLSSSIFRIDWSDIQTTVRTPLGFTYLGNAGKAVSQGLEAEINVHDILAQGLSFNLGYSYTDAKLTETISRIGFKGERMPLVPRHALSLMADYSAKISGDVKAGLMWLTTYTSGAYADFGRFKPITISGSTQPSATANPQYLPIKSYWLTNLSFRIENGNWSARIFADNLLGVRYTTSRRYQNANSPYAGSAVGYTANRPRTIGIALTKEF